MAQLGRPRTFDRTQAIDDALLLFWQHGYEATSLSQLKAGIGGGITAPSFYAAFGSKEGLFLEVVERYLATYGQVTEALFDLSLAPRQAVAQTLRASARMQCDPSHPSGCLIALGTMGVCAPSSAGVRAPLQRARQRTREGLLACVERAVAGGELPGSTDVQALAALFEGFLLGISPMARDGVALVAIEGAIDQLLGVLGGQ